MHEAVPVHMERSPVLSSAPVQPSGYSLIQVAQHHLEEEIQVFFLTGPPLNLLSVGR